MCENQLIECPIIANQIYTTDVHLFLSRENIIPDSEGGNPQIVKKILNN